VTNDCPIANYYSHEIRRICDEYKGRGLDCALVYIDPTMTDAAAARHARDFGHGDYPKVVDRDRALVEATGATVTPEVVMVRPDASIAYRGRIDNYYAELTKPRAQVTEHDWRDALDAILAGKVVVRAEVPAVGCAIPDKKFYRNQRALSTAPLLSRPGMDLDLLSNNGIGLERIAVARYLDVERDFPLIANHGEDHLFRLAHDSDDLAKSGYGHSVDLYHHVARPQTCLIGGRPFADGADEHAFSLAYTEELS